MDITAATLLRAWETGSVAPAADRAPSLLGSLAAAPAAAATDELTVGQCDARLFALRRAVFGERLDMTATCPACDDELELALDLGALQPPLADTAPEPVTVLADAYTIRCRVPRNRDLSELGAEGELTARGLVVRCAVEAWAGDGPAVDPAELPEPALEAVLTALAAADPGASTVLQIRCACGHEFADELDIRAVLWGDLTDWVGRTLGEVHLLAQAYGWTETEILALPGWRRRWYLEACGS